MVRGVVVDELGDTFGAGDRAAGSDDRGDTDPSEVFARSTEGCAASGLTGRPGTRRNHRLVETVGQGL